MSSDRDLVLQLPCTVFDKFKAGVNFYNDGSTRLIVFKAVDATSGSVTWSACFNKCRHNGGTFVADIEDSAVVTCAYHGWQLDCSTMEYVNPPDCVKQDPLIVEFDSNAMNMKIFIQVQSKPWLLNRRQKQAINPGELGVTYFSHACVEIRAGSKTIVTDPWLTGPAFARGWWLLHEPPADAFERVAKADAIYISHSHPDHCNVPTLKRILAINPEIQIFVADLHKPIFKGDVAALGIKNVHVVSLGSWIDFDADTRMMILPDKLYPHLDTALLVEYKGHRILNLVDCCNPNDGNLPDDVSLLLTDFASGASGFPSCFSDMYGEEKVLQVAQEKATTFLKKIAKHVALTQAKAWLPFAGYFVEAHPSDEIVKRLNWKNTPQRAEKMLLARFPHLISWIPHPGGIFDIASMSGTTPDPSFDFLAKRWDFDPYVDEINLSMQFAPLQSLAGIQYYFDWAQFGDYNMQLEVQEFDNDFRKLIRKFVVDFRNTSAIVRPDRVSGVPLFCMRARASVFRQVLKNGSSWDDLYIGFSGRFHVEPDVYHMKFLDCFLNKLPDAAPQWQHFECLESPDAAVKLDSTPRSTFVLVFLCLMMMSIAWLLLQ